MSLINDALKRTKEAQQRNTPAAESPALRPAETASAGGGKGAQTLIFVLVASVILGNLMLWMAFKDRGAKQVAATTLDHAPAPSPAPEPAATPTVAASPRPAVAAASPNAPGNPGSGPAVTPALTTAVAPEPAAPAPETNSVGAKPEPAVIFQNPQPKPLRLQSIIFNPSQPSAMIGGKFLFIGDSVQGHQVIAIDKETVTLVGEGRTNVLRLR